MRSWIDRALAENDVDEINCQKGPKGQRVDSTLDESTAKRGQKNTSVSFGSDSDAAALPRKSGADPTTLVGGRLTQRTVEASAGESVLTRRGVICVACKKLGRGYGNDRKGYVCPGCAEWSVSGCSSFTALTTCQEALEARCGACLSCGASIELHGSPSPSEWRRVESLDDVQLVQAKLVLAYAKAIAKAARR